MSQKNSMKIFIFLLVAGWLAFVGAFYGVYKLINMVPDEESHAYDTCIKNGFANSLYVKGESGARTVVCVKDVKAEFGSFPISK